MKHLLVIKKSHFFDPHGSPDDGSITKFVTTKERYLLLNKKAYYSDDVEYLIGDKTMTEEEVIEGIEESTWDEDSLHAEDGYNLELFSYKVKEITQEQAKQYEEIIKQYNKI